MALDTNIALGIKPIEQPNMLAQMGQMMQLRQLQQEYEGENSLRGALQNGLPEDPSTLLKYGSKGRAVYESVLKGNKDKLDSAEKYLGLYKDQAGFIKNPEDAARWLTAFYANPATRPFVEATAPLDKALAAIPRNDPAAFQAWLRNASLKSEKLFVDANTAANNETSRYATNTAAGTAANRLNFDKLKDTREQDQLKAVLGIVSPGTVSSATALPINMGGGGAPTTQMPPVNGVQTPASGVAPVTPAAGAVTPATGAVGQPNVLATQVAPPQTSVPVPTTVNNLGQGSQKDQLVNQISQLARIPTTAASRALEMKVKEFNVLYPTEKIEQDRQGNLITIVNGVSKPVVGMTGLPVQGKPLPETAFERSVGTKTGEDTVAFVKRAEAAPKNIAKIDEALGILKSGGAVTGFGAENRLNLQRAMSLFGDDVKSGKRVVDTQILDALLGSDVFPSLQSLGLGSKNIDTPAEREYLRQVITGTIQLDNDALIRLTQIRRNVETNAIKEYNQKLESGKFNKYSKAADQKLEKIEVPNPIIRKGTHKNGRPVIEYADGTVEYGN